MLVSCSKCGSKYQLSDEKIKSAGTKVRCPRCQNTFKVFPTENEPDPLDDRTELFLRKPGAAPQPTPPKRDTDISATQRSPAPANRAQTEIQPQSPSSRKPEPASTTEVDEDFSSEDFPGFSGDFPKESEVPPTTVRAPIVRDPARTPPSVQKEVESAPASEEEFSSGGEEASEPTNSPIENEITPRPFGDATFFAIQKMGSGKQSRRRVMIALSLVLIVVTSFFLLTRGPSEHPTSSLLETRKVETVKVPRPANWYDDDPEISQRFLAQMATLPPSEQTQPKNRALIAEALIINGIFSGNFDQVAQGMGFASGLIAGEPDRAYGFYALATYALYKEDITTLGDLLSRWPEGNRTDLDFQLASIVIGAKANQKSTALELARDLLAKTPEFRVKAITLSVAVEAWPEAQQILGATTLNEIATQVKKRREQMDKAQIPLPSLLKGIDRKLQRRLSESSVARSPTPPPAPSRKEIAESPASSSDIKQAMEDSVTENLNRRVADKLKEAQQQAEPKPVAPKAKPTPPPPAEKPASKRLPKPSADLVAANKQEVKEESEAAKLYREGEKLLKNSKPDEAIIAFQKSLRFDPDFAESYRKLGEIFMAKADKERALRSFKIYLQLKPDSTDKQLVEGWISSLQ